MINNVRSKSAILFCQGEKPEFKSQFNFTFDKDDKKFQNAKITVGLH